MCRAPGMRFKSRIRARKVPAAAYNRPATAMGSLFVVKSLRNPLRVRVLPTPAHRPLRAESTHLDCGSAIERAAKRRTACLMSTRSGGARSPQRAQKPWRGSGGPNAHKPGNNAVLAANVWCNRKTGAAVAPVFLIAVDSDRSLHFPSIGQADGWTQTMTANESDFPPSYCCRRISHPNALHELPDEDFSASLAALARDHDHTVSGCDLGLECASSICGEATCISPGLVIEASSMCSPMVSPMVGFSFHDDIVLTDFTQSISLA